MAQRTRDRTLLTQTPSRAALRPARWQATSVPQRLLARLGGRRGGLVALLVAMIGLLAAGLGVGRAVDRSLTRNYTDQLQTILDADVAALELWLDAQIRLATTIAGDDQVIAATRRLAALGADDEDAAAALRTATEQTVLSQAMENSMAGDSAIGFGLFDPMGRVLGFAPETGTIGQRLTGAGLALLAGPRRGEATVLRPVLTEPLLESVDTVPSAGSSLATPMSRAMSIAVPVRDGDRVIGMFLLRLDPDRDFTRILSVARMGETGETYAFDDKGYMLSESRFEEQLRSAGFVPASETEEAAFTIQVRDPGGNVTRGHVPSLPVAAMPFTRMAASAIAGEGGVDVDGYRDYRGVEVIGAWKWLDSYGFGVATEVDKREAFAVLRPLRLALWAVFAGLAVVTALVVSSTFAIGALGRRIEQVQQLGQYTLERKIGEGGMGSVYLARHAMLSRPTALKLLRPEVVSDENVRRFEREVQLTSQLAHPNIVEIYDYGRSPEGVFYFAMEYLPGLTLTALIKGKGPVPPARTIHLLRQTCAALEEAHAAGLVHRDIKPLNIMVCRRGTQADLVKVLDFGLVKDVETPEELQVTKANFVGGTPPYIAPERLKDPQCVDPRSDLFSVGVVAFNLITGGEIWEGISALEICRKVMHEEPPRPSEQVEGLPEGLEALVLALLAKDPAARPQTARAVIDALDAIPTEGWSDADARAWWGAHGTDREASA
jgi:hypothetical protein